MTLYTRTEALLKGAYELREATMQEVIEYMGDEQVLTMARMVYAKRQVTRGAALTSPQDTRNLLHTLLAERETERFVVIFLDNQHHYLTMETLATGTIDSASVYPREVVRKAIEHNASAVILAHNHPSSDVTPSVADKRITRRLVGALGMIDVRILDHFIVHHHDGESYSFAEHGII